MRHPLFYIQFAKGLGLLFMRVFGFSFVILAVSISSLMLWERLDQADADAQLNVSKYNPTRDRQAVIDAFEEDKFWLTAARDFSAGDMLDQRSPRPDSPYAGKLKFLVGYTGNEFAGFVGYYMKSEGEGRILYLWIKKPLRSQGYGGSLLGRSITELSDLGARDIEIVTRVANGRAFQIYKNFGFHEVKRKLGFIYMSMPENIIKSIALSHKNDE